MLAQNFKTAADLGISDKEFDALLKVLGMLERAEATFVPVKIEQCSSTPLHYPPNGFNMSVVRRRRDCGTVCCLLGWARELSSCDELFYWKRYPKKLSELFQMNGRGSNPNATPAQAAIALRNYLTHGEPRWDEALAA